ncbi:MAG: TonB-dependent receptor [Cellvibrionaceae bacterium]|nr:TonB-dependent receptor [Cellvibrionaceae bacterium]
MKLTPLYCSLALAVSAAAQGQDFAIEEIVVTAQKRAENLQDVPIAITAMNQEMLKEAGIVGIDNIAHFTPGFAMSSYNKSSPQPYIRGIGTNTSGAGDDASVAMFIDDVYISRAGAYDSNLFDLERVEVLRGPQGTLYGKNVVGGALNITTRKPNTEELEASVRLDVGNYNRRGVQAYVSGPLADTVAAKLSLASLKRDGFVDNTVTGTKLRDTDTQAARGGLLWDASDKLSVSWNWDVSKVRESGVGRVLVGAPLLGVTALAPSLNQRDKTDTLNDGFTDRDVWGTSVKLVWEQDYGTWTSVTAYRSSEYSFTDDLVPALDLLSGAKLNYFTNHTDEDESQFSQELRLDSSGEGALEWTVGVYYFDDDIKRLEQWDTSLVGTLLKIGQTQGQADASNQTESQALFAQASYNLDDWRFTLGGRYTRERKDASLVGQGFEPLYLSLYAPFSAAADKTWNNFSGKFSIDYMGLEDTLIYLSLSEGFKSGAFNSIAGTKAAAERPLNPELATQYELGIKSQWFDNRVRVNAVVFDIDYEDLQVFYAEGLDVLVDNAGQASSKGAELELLALPAAGLELSASYSYLDASYDEFLTSGRDNSGKRLTRAPKNSYNLAASYRLPLGDMGELSLRLDYINQGSMFLSAGNEAALKLPSYELYNARLGFSAADGSWELALWGKNLGDAEYAIHRADLSTLGSATTSDILGDPRTYGLSFSYHL